MNRNDNLLQIAIKEKIPCKFYGRRMHTIIGVPITLDVEFHRLYIEQKDGEISILLGDISAYEFPSIITEKFKLNEEIKIPLNIQYQNYVEGLKKGEKKLSYDEFISKEIKN
jgi:hypothetical protein